jgi:hypothetical protein
MITDSVLVISAAEALGVAEAVRDNFIAHSNYSVLLWNDIFDPNRGYLSTLMDYAGFVDYVIAVFTGDDGATIRDRNVLVTRDNVIFEFGLFLGRIGARRAYFIMDERVELFSDWSGIKVARFKRENDIDHRLSEACAEIREAMDKGNSARRFSVQPSTALANAYYNDRLSHILDAFEELDVYWARESPTAHDRNRGWAERQIRDHYPTIHIKLPERLGQLDIRNIRRIAADRYRPIMLLHHDRTLHLWERPSSSGFQFIDFPTILLSSKHIIEKTFSSWFLEGRGGERQHRLERREIENFRTVISDLSPGSRRRPRLEFENW